MTSGPTVTDQLLDIVARAGGDAPTVPMNLDARAAAECGIKALERFPKIKPAGSYAIHSCGKMVNVLLSDGQHWAVAASYEKEAMQRYLMDRGGRRRRCEAALKQAECVHDWKGNRKAVGRDCVKCGVLRPKAWKRCDAYRPELLDERGHYRGWSREICPFNHRQCRRRKGHPGKHSWELKP